MKRLLLLTLVLSFTFTVFSQKTKEKGDDYYKAYSYKESVAKYERIKDKDIDINRKLAISYYNLNDYLKSMEYWEQVVKDDKHESEDLYNYAAVLAINERYEEAEEWMTKFYEQNKGDRRAQMRVADAQFYKLLQENKGIFTVENSRINSEQQDFGTCYFKDKIVFASSRAKPAKIIKRVWNWNELPYLDIYVADVDSSNHLKKVSKFRGKDINKKLHEGPATFNKAGDYMVFTRNNYAGQSEDDIVKLQLFSTKFENDKWTEPQAFSFNSSEYSVGHAALTENADTMYFVSDMPGGYGGTDLYMITREGEGSWTEPVNLGETVNTEGNEMFPFIHPDGLLFFASNGFPGLGGLDVFVSPTANGKIGKAENLGVPINSSYDDFAFILDSAQQSGFFSSNRKDGNGDDDIYSFKLSEPLKVQKFKYIAGKAHDENGVVLANVEVLLLDADGNTLSSVITDETGKYKFTVEPDKKYSLSGTKTDYTKGNVSTNTSGEEEIVYADLLLKTIPKSSLLLVVTDAETGLPLDPAVVMTDHVKNSSENFSVPSEGRYLISLSDKKLNDVLDYSFALTREGYLPNTHTFKQTLNKEGQIEVHVQMRKAGEAVAVDPKIELPIIYFDFDKSNIRTDASEKLDEVVAIMQKYPTIVIELSSHTDCRGSKAYNIALSDRRAKSSAKYIKARISNPERIYGKGYGESRLTNGCACEGDEKSSCSEAEHQLNRRTEFEIIKY